MNEKNVFNGVGHMPQKGRAIMTDSNARGICPLLTAATGELAPCAQGCCAWWIPPRANEFFQTIGYCAVVALDGKDG